MARKLGDVLHFFLDDAPPEEAPPANPVGPHDPGGDLGNRGDLGDRRDPVELARTLGRLDPPLEVVAGAVPGEGLRLDAVAREPDGRGVVVLVAGQQPDAALLTRGLAQLRWLQLADAAHPLRGRLSGEAPGLVLISERFPAQLRQAAAHLGESRVRLVRRFSSRSH